MSEGHAGARAGAKQAGEPTHWLVRPATVQGLWIAFIAVLAATVAAGLAVDMHPHFEIERFPAFFAVFGFLACVAMVLGSKLLGLLLKRPDDYYDR